MISLPFGQDLFTLMSLVTSVKDYVEITHKLIEIEPLKNYTEFGAVFTYFICSVGDFFKNVFSFSFLKNIWSIPIIIPDIASAMISEISVLDGYFHNAFTFLETNVNTATNPSLVIFEKFIIGLINSFFLFLPTSTSHLITLRRFVMQGLEAGYLAGLGTLAGNFLWLGSIILGWRFFVIPWLSLDIFRYLLGFILLVKYIWDSSKERRMALEDLSKWKIFLLNFLLALTEQSCIYPFITNLSIGPEASILEGFPVENYPQFLAVHGAYLLGILLGSFSLLQFTCWFWENPAFSIYLWITTYKKISTSTYYKVLNFTFLYCTMLCAIASIPYYGLDYTITNPIGLVPQDRILDQKKSQSDPDKLITETAFLGINPTDKNSRIRDGVHARRERWKQRLIKYQAFDASTYDQGVYDFLTIEDLNYGFDRFWLRRKMRNHQIRFRLFPGPWMRSLKKQLNNRVPLTGNNISNQESSNKAASGPRVEFFRILFEQFYHPNFHDRRKFSTSLTSGDLFKQVKTTSTSENPLMSIKNQSQLTNGVTSSNTSNTKVIVKPGLIYKNSALRKFVRNVNTRINLKYLNFKQSNLINKYNNNLIYSKRWKNIFTKIISTTKTSNKKSYQLFRNVAKQLLTSNNTVSFTGNLIRPNNIFGTKGVPLSSNLLFINVDHKLLNLRTSTQLNSNISINLTNTNKILGPEGFGSIKGLQPFRPDNIVLSDTLNVYLQKEQAFKRKLRYYGAAPMRKLTVGNQAPYFKALMKRGFYYYKPTLRWKKTLYVASMRRGFRKKSRKQRILVNNDSVINKNNNITKSQSSGEHLQSTLGLTVSSNNYKGADAIDLEVQTPSLIPPTHSYTVLGKRASRYRHQIYKDVLQHWYYTPFNRLLLKFDVDAFINRQPKSHFLTKNEERLLHIRRFLLSEHYDTLRWYTYMQHYKTMKSNIGGTKSFASRSYNQQFQGTFKKIRHLFAITPKQGDLYTLKYDQPLYNDNKIKDSVYFHEELLAENSTIGFPPGGTPNNNQFSDRAIRQEARSTLNSANSSTNNILNNNLDNNSDLINQSKFLIGQEYLNKNLNKESQLTQTTDIGKTNNINVYNFVPGELFVKLIKECKKRIQDQTFLKNYITHRIEKRDQLNQESLSALNKRLEKLKIWLNTQKIKDGKTVLKKENNLLTTGMQKALNDSIALDNKEITPVSIKTEKELISLQKIKTEEDILNKLMLIDKITTEKNQNIGTSGWQSFCRTYNLTNQFVVVQNAITNIKPIFYTITKKLQARTDKNLEWWRKKERVITKRKNSRKRDRFKKQLAVVTKKRIDAEKSNLSKTLYGNYDISDYLLKMPVQSSGTQKITDSNLLRKKEDKNFIDKNTSIWQEFFTKKLRKKVSSKGRRYRSLSLARYLTATRKPRLVGLDNLTKIDNISNLKGAFLTKEEKQERLNNSLENNTLSFTLSKLKTSQIKKRSRHSWKKRARHQFSRNHYKYRKRHIHGNGKLRVMNKKLKKFKATNELRQWWWSSFLPRYLDSFGDNKQLPLSGNNEITKTTAFKPLSNTNSSIVKENKNTVNLLIDDLNSSPSLSSVNPTVKLSASSTETKINNTQQPSSEQLRLSVGIDFDFKNGRSLNSSLQSTENLNTTSLPFYAGWDESLRKFVVTNRLLSRRDTGLGVTSLSSVVEFTNAPIQGLNEGSFLYWQTDMPFNSYNIDQFITTNQSFYAPLGWRRFEFRHSILKTWATKKISTVNNTLIVSMKNLGKNTNIFETIKNKKAIARRIKKRYKLIKQMPNILMYSPTGPLLTEVLPSHYISVFDQQYRFPRNRYLKRNPLKTLKKTTLLAMVDNNTIEINKEFTLRKRVKPRRKYHRKRTSVKEGLIFPRRMKFTTNNTSKENILDGENENLRWRPSSRSKQKRSTEASALYKKNKSNKRVVTNPLRLRQLRRREFQQILKPVQRYIPRNGGFTWPGDYLRLEIVEMPKLKSINTKKTSSLQKINVQPVGIMPRKYLIEKHNIKVLKKKLEKAYSTHHLSKTIQEYKNILGQ